MLSQLMSWRRVLRYDHFEHNYCPQAGIWRGYAVDYASRSLGLALFENTTHVFPFTLSMDMLGFTLVYLDGSGR